MIPRFPNLANVLRQLEQTFMSQLFGKFPPRELALAYVEAPRVPIPATKFSLKDIIGEGFLWAVPKSRRSLEKRWKRKYGVKEYVWKILEPKTNIKVCSTCGHHHERSVLCAHCYKKVELETKEILEKMHTTGLKPVEQDVIVLYEGESTPEKPDEYWKGKRIIEMKKERPQWFSKNLLQKTTQQPSNSTDVKPTELA